MDWEQWELNNQMLGNLQRKGIQDSQEETNRLLREQEKDRKRQQKLPDCPHCGHKIPKNGVSVCGSCRRDIEWYDDRPYKDYESFKEEQKEKERVRKENERVRKENERVRALQRKLQRKQEEERKRAKWEADAPAKINDARVEWIWLLLVTLFDSIFLALLLNQIKDLTIEGALLLFIMCSVEHFTAMLVTNRAIEALARNTKSRFKISENSLLETADELDKIQEARLQAGCLVYWIPFITLLYLPSSVQKRIVLRTSLTKVKRNAEGTSKTASKSITTSPLTDSLLEDNVPKIKHQYYLKRDDTVKGPLQYEQVVTFIESKKAKKTDLISRSKDGPFQALEDFWKTHRKK